MQTCLKFFNAEDRSPSDCGAPLVIQTSSRDLGWEGLLLEKGWSPHFHPENIVTPYFYFALAMEEDLKWMARQGDDFKLLKTIPGEIWLNPPWTPFSHRIDEACFFTILAVEPRALQAAHPDPLPMERLQFLNNYNLDDALLKNFIELFMFEVERGGANGTRYVRNLLTTLSEYFINNFSNYKTLEDERPVSRISKAEVSRVEQYILANLEEPVTVEELALELNMSKFHFLREFKKAAGKTPHQFLVELKMQEARKFMAHGELTLADVALQLGYSDQSHFSRVFKQYFGETPGNFRRRLPASS